MNKQIRLLVMLSAVLLLFFLPCEAAGADRDEIFADLSGGEAAEAPSGEASPDWDAGFWDDWSTDQTIGSGSQSFEELEEQTDRLQAERDAIFNELLREADPVRTYPIAKLQPLGESTHVPKQIPLLEGLPWSPEAVQETSGISSARLIAAIAFFLFAAAIVIYLVISSGKEKPEDCKPEQETHSH